MAFTPFVESDLPTMANFNEKLKGIYDYASKARVISYVGTGLYGPSNPCSIRSESHIVFAMFLGSIPKNVPNGWAPPRTNLELVNIFVEPSSMPTEFSRYFGFGYNGNPYGKISEDGREISWYNETSATNQFNEDGAKYFYLIISDNESR